MRRVHVFLSALAVLFLTGCATTGVQSGYLGDYGKLKPGQYLKGFHADVGLSTVSSLRVREVDTSKAPGVQSVFAKDASPYFRNSLQVAAKKYGMDSYFVFESSGVTDATLELALTKVDPGDANSRMWAGELGMGHAMVQAEGRVVASDGKELALFSEQRRSSGGAGLRDIGGDAGPVLVNEMLDQLANNIVQEFRATQKKT